MANSQPNQWSELLPDSSGRASWAWATEHVIVIVKTCDSRGFFSSFFGFFRYHTNKFGYSNPTLYLKMTRMNENLHRHVNDSCRRSEKLELKCFLPKLHYGLRKDRNQRKSASSASLSWVADCLIQWKQRAANLPACFSMCSGRPNLQTKSAGGRVARLCNQEKQRSPGCRAQDLGRISEGTGA